MVDTYREQVINLGDDASKMMYLACQHTWPNREGRYGEVEMAVDHFRGDRHWGQNYLLEVPKPEGIKKAQETDGIGTKVFVVQKVGNYATVGHDLVAMAADDAAARGYEPVIMTTALAVNRLNNPRLAGYMEQLSQGAIGASNLARIAMFGGETAIVGKLIGGYGSPDRNLHFDWTAAVHAAGHADRLVDGSAVRPGMALVGLAEPGLRSNWLTKVQEVLEEEYGRQWFRRRVDLGEGPVGLGDAALRPSVIYSPVLVDAIGGYDLRVKKQAHVAGVSHNTGGGLVGKLGDMLAVTGNGADIEDPYEVPEIAKLVQKGAEMPDDILYGNTHGGQGMVVATSEPEKFISVSKKNKVDAKQIGFITKEPGIRLRSAGAYSTGRKLSFAP